MNTKNPNRTSTCFGLTISKKTSEKLHDLVALRGVTRNNLLNEALNQYLDSQSKQEQCSSF